MILTFTPAVIGLLMSLGFLNSPSDLDTMTPGEIDALYIIIEDNTDTLYDE